MKERRGLVSRYEDLQPLTVGIVRGYVYVDRFDSDTRINRVLSGSEEQLLKMVAIGRLDAALVDRQIGNYILAKQNLADKLEEAEYRICANMAGYFGLSKYSVHAPRIKQFNETMEEMINDGTVATILKTYAQPGDTVDSYIIEN